MELVASQRIEKCAMLVEYAEECLIEVQDFIEAASEFSPSSSPKDLRNAFQESSTPETKALVTQVNWIHNVLHHYINK